MAMRERKRIPAGFLTLERGVNSGIAPTLLPVNQCAAAENMTFRGGYPSVRPSFRFVGELPDGRFQGVSYFRDGMNRTMLVAFFDGVCYRISGDGVGGIVNLDVTVDADLRLFPKSKQVYFEQVESHLVCQDGRSKAIIYSGGATTRRAASDEVPVGTAMAYGLGRLAVAQRNRIYIGDIVGGPTSPLKFTETTYLAEGGSFRIPVEDGIEGISGMAFVALGDTATGQGELVVGTRKSFTSINTALPREQWKETTVQRVATRGAGCTSEKSMVQVNSDLWIRAADGIRSYRMARAEFGQWGQTPQSREVSHILDFDDERQLDGISATLFDNRLLMTVNPRADRSCRGLVALDFAPVAQMDGKSAPAYDALWTRDDFRPIEIVSGDFGTGDECYVVGIRPSDGKNVLYQITKNGRMDDGEAIAWSLDTRVFDFGDPFGDKMLMRADIFADKVHGDLSVTFEYRAACLKGWQSWQAHAQDNETEICMTEADCYPPCLRDNCFYKEYGRPPEADRDGEFASRATEFQFRISGTGHCRLRRVRFHASSRGDPSYADANS
jgi:hypothetical protein